MIGEEMLNENAIMFNSPSYADALIGIDIVQERAVYDYEKMIQWLIDKEGISSQDEAIDFIEYNTINSLPMFGDKAPIIINMFDC